VSVRKIVYVDMDHVLCDYKKGFRIWQEKFPHLEFPQSEPGMYLALELMPGAISAYGWLEQHSKIDVHVLTAPSVLNPHCYTEKRLWVEKHLGMKAAENLIISPVKHLNKGDYLIDDMPCGKGQDQFEGELIQFGIREYPNWDAVIAYIDKQV